MQAQAVWQSTSSVQAKAVCKQCASTSVECGGCVLSCVQCGSSSGVVVCTVWQQWCSSRRDSLPSWKLAASRQLQQQQLPTTRPVYHCPRNTQLSAPQLCPIQRSTTCLSTAIILYAANTTVYTTTNTIVHNIYVDTTIQLSAARTRLKFDINARARIFTFSKLIPKNFPHAT